MTRRVVVRGARLWTGSLAYYYAHAGLPSESGSPRVTVKTLSKYSWADEKKKVKLYVDFPGVGALPEEAVAVEWTASSVKVTVTTAEGVHRLTVEPLSDGISGATVRRKENQFTLVLEKAVEAPWLDLKKAKVASDEDDA